MTLVKFKPAHTSFAHSFSPLFESVWGNALTDVRGRDNSTTVPAVNIAEHQDAFLIELASPGLSKDKFIISIKANAAGHNVLTIKAENSQSAETNTEAKSSESAFNAPRYTRREFSYESFERSFTLPTTVDPDGIHANYQDGILLVNIPKREEAKTKEPRTITIS